MPSSILKQTDVHQLTVQPSPHMRAVIAGKIAREMENPELTPIEMRMAEDIVRTLARDVQMMVRQALAHNLRKSKHMPHDVALWLANDVEAVALPILLDSQMLTDEDLLAFVRSSTVVKQKAIASRAALPERVIDEIVNTNGEVVVATLMNNASAQISDANLHKAIDRFGGSDMVKENIVKRPQLPVNVSERLIVMVSTQLKNYLIKHHQLPPAMAEEFSRQSHERVTVNVGHAKDQEEIEQLVDQMHASKRLTPTLVVRALCTGNLIFFEAGLAAMAGVKLKEARPLIHDHGQDALKALWEKASMPPKLLPIAVTCLDVIGRLKLDGEETDIQRFRARIIERVLMQLGNNNPEELEYLMDLLQ